MKHILILLLLTTSISFAQRGDKIKSLKRAFITEELDLTSSEAEKFWPIYNAHEDKMEALRKQERQEIFQLLRGNKIETLSDAEANVLIDKGIQFKSQEFEYNKELVQNLKGVIPSKKILMLKRAEQEFKRLLIDKVKGRKGPGNRQN